MFVEIKGIRPEKPQNWRAKPRFPLAMAGDRCYALAPIPGYIWAVRQLTGKSGGTP